MSAIDLEAFGIDLIYVAALVLAFSCLVYLLILTARERRELRLREATGRRSASEARPAAAPEPAQSSRRVSARGRTRALPGLRPGASHSDAVHTG